MKLLSVNIIATAIFIFLLSRGPALAIPVANNAKSLSSIGSASFALTKPWVSIARPTEANTAIEGRDTSGPSESILGGRASGRSSAITTRDGGILGVAQGRYFQFSIENEHTQN
jgi:hypothetical protein